jgi:hypothetical protein
MKCLPLIKIDCSFLNTLCLLAPAILTFDSHLLLDLRTDFALLFEFFRLWLLSELFEPIFSVLILPALILICVFALTWNIYLSLQLCFKSLCLSSLSPYTPFIEWGFKTHNPSIWLALCSVSGQLLWWRTAWAYHDVMPATIQVTFPPCSSFMRQRDTW